MCFHNCHLLKMTKFKHCIKILGGQTEHSTLNKSSRPQNRAYYIHHVYVASQNKTDKIIKFFVSRRKYSPVFRDPATASHLMSWKSCYFWIKSGQIISRLFFVKRLAFLASILKMVQTD